MEQLILENISKHVKDKSGQDPKVFLHRVIFQKVSPQCVLVHGVIPPHGKDFAFHFVELHQIPLCPVPHVVEGHISQFCIISRLDEGSLYPIV